MHDVHHLYRRAGFGLSPDEWKQRKQWSRQQAIDDLFREAKVAQPLPEGNASGDTEGMMSATAQAERRKEERKRVIQLNADWVMRMGNPQESALLERMSLFWHGHFACEAKFSLLATRQLNTLRKHALGNFRDLLLGIARDPAMIRYLNNQQNRKNAPNENFAREVMELFTVGRGHYTERDVKEAARAFTGWSSDLKGNFVFRRFAHDYGEKTVLGKTGNLTGEDVIDLLLQQEATATFICRKIYRHFVNDTVDEGRIAELAASFRASNYDIGQLMRRLFSSDWFYAAGNVGTRIKSPVELLAGLIRQLGVQRFAENGLIGLQRALGQLLFRPPNVAGWPGGRAWIDNSTLLLRLNLGGAFLRSGELDFTLAPELEQAQKQQLRRLGVELNATPLISLANQPDNLANYTALGTYLLAAPLPPLNATTRRILDGKTTDPVLLITGILTLPEYQLC